MIVGICLDQQRRRDEFRLYGSRLAFRRHASYQREESWGLAGIQSRNARYVEAFTSGLVTFMSLDTFPQKESLVKKRKNRF